MLKIDVFNHIFPKPFFDRLQDAVVNKGAVKRWLHIPFLYDIDVRFRLHRFAPHIVEHTVQCEKTLLALGWRPTEGRRIARYVAAAIGEVEGLGARKDARQLETELAERIASVGG